MEDKKQEMKDKKQKFAYWMRPSLVAEMTEMLESANATSKSDFVCQAVEFYIGYLWQQKTSTTSPLSSPVSSGMKSKAWRKMSVKCCSGWRLSKPNSVMRSQPTVIIQRKPCSDCINNASIT